tara:strand:- start:211 stop:957 length:747 start_codon:yes stop_codon:yes gene_type:complete
MNNLLSLFVASLFMLGVPTLAAETQGDHNITVEKRTEEVKSSMTIIEKKVRDAAVKVSSSTGHGSGSVITYKDVILVLTAQHVAEGLPGDLYVVSKDSESQLGVLIYSDALHDIAILYMPNPLREAKPMKYDPLEGIADVGTEITYSGYPSDHRLMTIRGSVAGYETMDLRGTQIIIHTHGWFGCSGSVVYNSKGKIVGILWGVDVERRPSFQVIDNMVWISPIKNINLETSLNTLCVALNNKPKACR